MNILGCCPVSQTKRRRKVCSPILSLEATALTLTSPLAIPDRTTSMTWRQSVSAISAGDDSTEGCTLSGDGVVWEEGMGVAAPSSVSAAEECAVNSGFTTVSAAAGAERLSRRCNSWKSRRNCARWARVRRRCSQRKRPMSSNKTAAEMSRSRKWAFLPAETSSRS